MTSERRARGLRCGLARAVGQAPADHSRKAAPEEHQQFGAVASVEAELGALPEDQQTGRQRRLAFDPDQCLGANELARRAEQGMPAFHGAHLDARDLTNRPAEDEGVHHLHSAAVGAEPLVADDQRERDRVDPEDQRPFLRDDVEQTLDAAGFHRRENGGVDGRDGARMAAGEGDEILVGFLRRSQPLAQMRNRAFLEMDHLAHRAREYARSG